MPKKSAERKVRRKSLKVKRKSRRKPKKVKSKSRRKSIKVRRKPRKSRRKSKKIRRKSKKIRRKSKNAILHKKNIKKSKKGKSTYNFRKKRSLVQKCFESLYISGGKIDHIPIIYNIKWWDLTFKIMFWNIQGTSSSDGGWFKEKMNCVIDIVHWHNPDLVYFSEVSHLLEENFLGKNYELVGISYELDKNMQLGTKDLRCYRYSGGNLANYINEGKIKIGKTRLERSGDVRGWLSTRVVYGSYYDLEITGLHARASKDGGKSNINQIIDTKIKKPSRNTSYIFGGDFNLDLNREYDWGYEEKYTPEFYVLGYSEAKGKIERPEIINELFYSYKTEQYGTQKSGGLLDYILVSSDIKAEALAPWQ